MTSECDLCEAGVFCRFHDGPTAEGLARAAGERRLVEDLAWWATEQARLEREAQARDAARAAARDAGYATVEGMEAARRPVLALAGGIVALGDWQRRREVAAKAAAEQAARDAAQAAAEAAARQRAHEVAARREAAAEELDRRVARAHRDGRTVAAVVLIWRGTGRALMVRRRNAPLWGLPGGKVERGEDPRAAASRELHEETGLRVSLGALRPVHVDDVDGALVLAFEAPDPGGEVCPGVGEAEAQFGDWRLLAGRRGAFPEYNRAVIYRHSLPGPGDRYYGAGHRFRRLAEEAMVGELGEAEFLRPALERFLRTGDAAPEVEALLQAAENALLRERFRRAPRPARTPTGRAARGPSIDDDDHRCGAGTGCLRCHGTDLLGCHYSAEDRLASRGCGGHLR